jgi:hypothetical protein
MCLGKIFIKRRLNSGTKLCSMRDPFQFRILHIYRRALKMHSSDINLWFSFLNYCRVFSRKKILSKALVTALRFCPHSSGLWSYAISCELKDKNISGARIFAQRGLRYCVNRSGIWLKYVDFEKDYATKLQKRQKITSESSAINPVKVCYPYSMLRILIKNAIEYHANDRNFLLNLLRVCTKFKSLEELDNVVQIKFTDNCDSQPEFLLRLFDSEICMLNVLLLIAEIYFLKSRNQNLDFYQGRRSDFFAVSDIINKMLRFLVPADHDHILSLHFAVENFSFLLGIKGIFEKKQICLLHMLKLKDYAACGGSAFLLNFELIENHIFKKNHKIDNSTKFSSWRDRVFSKDKKSEEVQFLNKYALSGLSVC